MGFLDVLFERRASTGQAFHVSQTPPGWVDALAGSLSSSGVVVNEDNALSYGALFTCVRVLAEGEAMLPLILYRRRAGGGRDRATERPLYSILHDAPNPEMTSLQFRETLMGHLCTWGNAYAEIEWSNGGKVLGLWPLRPDRMAVSRQDGELVYDYRLPESVGGAPKRFNRWQVLHVAGFGYDGLIGYSPIRLFQDAIGMGMATEEFGSRFYANDASPGGVLEHPGKLGDTAYDRLRDSWEARHKGLSNKYRVAILEEGLKWHEIGLPPSTAQFLETRTFQKREMAMIYRVSPHLLGDLERATFSNIEQLGQEFVTYTMMPWLVRIEQAIALKLLLPAERRVYFVEHLVAALLRGDLASRYQAYGVGRQWGWLNADDVRELENMNPLPDGQGQIYLIPMNMIPADQAGEGMASLETGGDEGGQEEPSQEEQPQEGSTPQERAVTRAWEQRSVGFARARHRLMRRHLGMYQDVLARVIRREVNDVGAAVKRFAKAQDSSSLALWLADFYREHAGWTIGQVKALAFSYGQAVAELAEDEAGPQRLAHREEGDHAGSPLPREVERFIQRYLEAFGRRMSTDSLERLRERLQEALADGLDWEDALLEELEGWRETRPDEEALDEAVRFNNSVARTVYILAGVMTLVWRAMGESCPYCNALNGSVVSIVQSFLPAGTEFQPEGADKPLTVTKDRRHPPLHGGCDCMATAGR